MKRYATALLILAALSLGSLVLPACHAPVTVTTPAGQTAYTADQIAIRVGELQNAAIQAEATGSLPTAQARIIVTYCVQASQVLQATPAGWAQTVAAAWTEARKQIPINNPLIAAAVSGMDVALAAYLGG